jgi:hypothetical protein
MSPYRWAAAVLACVAGLAAGAGVGAPAARAEVPGGTVTKAAGSVSATLSWQSGEFAATSPRLQISRGGTVVSDLDVSDECKECLLVADSGGFSILHVADLDGDGEPEVLFDTNSGGAHCCTTTRIYGFTAATGTYRRTASQYWGNSGYDVKDLDRDGRAELSGGEDAFAYAFSSYSASVFPPKIVRYTVDRTTGRAKLTQVQKRFPAVVRRQAAALRKAIRRARPATDGTHEIQGAIAAYVADEYLLGHGAVGRAAAARARRRGLTAPGFERDLLTFLKRFGYR